MAAPKTIHTLAGDNFSWVNATRAEEQEMLYLEKNFKLHPLDTRECLPPLQRPKLIPRPDYLFLILVFPIFNRKTREIEPEEVDIFIKKDMVITVHNDQLLPIQNFFELLEVNKEHRDELFASPAYFITQLLDVLFDGCFPMLLHISHDIDAVSKQVLRGYTKTTIHEILRLKNNIVYFRKAMQPHRDLVFRLRDILPEFFPVEKHAHYFNRLIDHSKEIWDNLDTYNFAIDALHQTHTTLISFHLNEIMRTLTIFSIIIFSCTLFATIFSMKAAYTPLIGRPFDFWLIVAIMALGALSALLFFRSKKWL